MNNELIGQMIAGTLISLILGGIGFVQYKSDTPFNIGFNKEGYNPKIVSKIIGIHVMIFAALLFVFPLILNQMKGIGDSKLIGAIFASASIIILWISINISISKTAKTTSKAIKNGSLSTGVGEEILYL
ncbi:MAG: hypothetical protein ACLROA_12495 [Turicibacter sp.]